MKYFSILILSFLIISCSEDDPISTAQLRLDSDNFTAPLLDPGTHEACAKFTVSELSEFTGRNIDALELYFVNKPNSASINIYEGTLDNLPRTRVHSQEITNQVENDSWIFPALNSPVAISSSDLWICVELFHTERLGTIGCDPGPAAPNGDWYKFSGDNLWQSFRSFTNQEANINWNIRAHVAE